MKKKKLFMFLLMTALLFIAFPLSGCSCAQNLLDKLNSLMIKEYPINNESEFVKCIQEDFSRTPEDYSRKPGERDYEYILYELNNDITITSTSIESYWSGRYNKCVPKEATEEEFVEEYTIYYDMVLDGKNHTIKNLSLSGFGASIFGMIGNKSNLTVKNITFDNLTINGRGPVGALLASANGGTINFENVHIINSNITSESNYPIGGFIGQSDGTIGTIKNCSVENTTINGAVAEDCGGFIGKNSLTIRGELLTVSDCESKNNTISAKCNVGGFFGELYQSYADYKADRLFEFKNLTNSSTVTATDIRAGGIAGHLSYWDYSNFVFDTCKNEANATYTAEIKSTNNSAGGILGSANWNGTWAEIPGGCQINFNNCTNNMRVTATENVGGISGYISDKFWYVNYNNCKNLGYGSVDGIHKIGGISGTIDGTIFGGKQFTYTNCENNGMVDGFGSYIGGIAGYNNALNPLFTNCKSTSQHNWITGEQYVGGISGRYGTFVNCENTMDIKHNGTVKTLWKYVGGIVGSGDNSTFTNCTNSGDIIDYTKCTGVDASYIGGIAGYTTKLLMTDCSNSGTIAGNECVGGLVGKSDAAFLEGQKNTLINCSNTGDIYAFGQTTTTQDNYNDKAVKGKIGLLIGSFYTGTLIFEFNNVTVGGNIYIINDTDYVGGWCGYFEEGSVNTFKNDITDSTIDYKIYLSQNVTNICKSNYRYGANIFDDEDNVGNFNNPTTSPESFTYSESDS